MLGPLSMTQELYLSAFTEPGEPGPQAIEEETEAVIGETVMGTQTGTATTEDGVEVP